MKNYMRRLPVRARPNSSDCPVPIEQLPPSLIIVPMTQAALGTLASFLVDRQLAASAKGQVERFSAEETKRLLGADPERVSALLLDPKAVLKASTKGYVYKDQGNGPEALTEITEPRAKQALYQAAGLPETARTPIYIAPVGDVETVYTLISRRTDRDALEPTRLPAVLNHLLASAITSPPRTWGIAVIVPQDIPLKKKGQEEGAPDNYLYEVDKFQKRLSGAIIGAGGNENKKLLYEAVAAITKWLYAALPEEQQKEKRLQLLFRCVYRVSVVPQEAQYMTTELAQLGRADFLPTEFVSRFIDVAVAQYLIADKLEEALKESKGQGVDREAAERVVHLYRHGKGPGLSRELVKQMVHRYRHDKRLYTLGDLEAIVRDEKKSQGIAQEDRAALLERIAQAQQMLTLRGLASLEKDEEKGTPRRQVNNLIGRMPSYYVENTFSAGPGPLPAQRSNVVAVLYATDWVTLAEDPKATVLDFEPRDFLPVPFAVLERNTLDAMEKVLSKARGELEEERKKLRSRSPQEFV